MAETGALYRLLFGYRLFPPGYPRAGGLRRAAGHHVTDSGGRLVEIGKKPSTREDIQGQFMGLLRFTPESWGWVEKTVQEPLAKPVGKLDMTTLLQELVGRGYPVQAIPTSWLWLECDSENDIDVYEQMKDL